MGERKEDPTNAQAVVEPEEGLQARHVFARGDTTMHQHPYPQPRLIQGEQAHRPPPRPSGASRLCHHHHHPPPHTGGPSTTTTTATSIPGTEGEDGLGNPTPQESGLSTAAAAGIGVGSTVGGVLLLILVGWFVQRRKRMAPTASRAYDRPLKDDPSGAGAEVAEPGCGGSSGGGGGGIEMSSPPGSHAAIAATRSSGGGGGGGGGGGHVVAEERV
ncbi:uncharacterized protein PG986_011434 [Apiospora aurea]|uniref:Uncharacterized protein n=1 Tax=Apiospora aurea TaxID=335848 RepID=A0ABR1Q521_9PEZI